MNYINGPSSHDQDLFEFRMRRLLLFAQLTGGLFAVHPGDSEYPTFSTHGLDPFESRQGERPEPVLERCRACHADSGIHSVQSRIQWMRKPVGRDKANETWFIEPMTWETDVTILRKKQQRDFQLLRRFWRGERE
jgi:hypothetical protein